MPSELDLGYRFKKSCLENGPRPAIQYQKNGRWCHLSYSELYERAASLSAFLSKEGLEKGDRVAILLENRPEWPLVFFATVTVGAVSVPLNPDSGEEEIENILKNSEPKILFTSDGPLLEKASSAQCESLKNVISVDSDRFKNVISSKGISEAKIETPSSDLVCILYTSGTTDKPKGVMLTHTNLLSNCESLYRLNIVSGKDSVVSILPLHHIYPMAITMILPLIYGARIIYPGSLKSEIVGEALRETNPTVLPAVPQVFYTFHRKIAEGMKKVPFPFNVLLKTAAELLYLLRKKTGLNLARHLFYGLHRCFGKSMRLFVSGGAKLDEEIERDFFKLGFTVVEGYGLTETSPVLSVNPVKKPRIGSVGFAVPGVKLDIVNKDENGIGEVVARGPNIMKGYYKRDDLTREVIRNGWFHTGDLGRFDEDGYLFLTGRSKDIIVLSSGLNIYPEEIEEAYSRIESVKEICVFDLSGVKGVKGSSVLWAVVKPDLEFFKKYGEINLRHVIKERLDNVSKSLPVSKRLKGFTITLEDLPHTPLGKVKRYAVKDLYGPRIAEEKKGVSGPEKISAEDLTLVESETGKKVIESLKRQMNFKGQVLPADSLELDLGIDSLGRIELASDLERALGVRIKDETVGNAFTVRDLIKNVGSDLAAGLRLLTPKEKESQYGSEYWKGLFEILPKKESLDKINLRPGVLDWLGGFIFLTPFYLIFKLFYRLKTEGISNIPKRGPCIFYVNHTSYLDGFLSAVSMPGFPRLDLFFVGFRPYFNVPVIRNLIKIGRIIPLDFFSHLLEALRSAYYVLKNDKCLCLFPEGLRTLSGEVGVFKKGFGILAKESGAKLLPIMIKGAYEAWPRTSKFPKIHPIKIIFGEPIEVEDLERRGAAMGAKDGYESICLAAREALIALGKEER